MKYAFITLLILMAMAPVAWSSTSLENRGDKTIELSLQVGQDYRMSPTQLGGMYFINPNNLIGLKVGIDRQGHESQTSIALQYKYYTGNSFYFAGEAFYLNSREEINGYYARTVFNLKEEYANYKSLGAGIRFGNQWTWKHFTFGCDWLGVGHRFGTFTKDTSKLSDTTVTLLNFIIGASF
jgi:hypothetical protein